MDKIKKITILGSTGSIGKSTLEVIRLNKDKFKVFALIAKSQIDLIYQQCLEFKPNFVILSDEKLNKILAEKIKENSLLKTQVLDKSEIENLASHDEVDLVMSAIVGVAGMFPTLAAVKSGKKLLLANKESLVVGGSLLMEEVRKNNCELIPIDSEHSAIFQCLPLDKSTWKNSIKEIILTSSGGPFRTFKNPKDLENITPEQACKHPNFSMGQKISVDSATMMNKSLEIIEAHWLFDLKPEQIKVLIHPQQIVHSMVKFIDNSILAQLGTPDMKVPISCGLDWSNRIPSGAGDLDFLTSPNLSFEAVNQELFPSLNLAWQVLKSTEGTSVIFNASNEIAVESFLNRKLRFNKIYNLISETLEKLIPQEKPTNFEMLLNLDFQARLVAKDLLKKYQEN